MLDVEETEGQSVEHISPARCTLRAAILSVCSSKWEGEPDKRDSAALAFALNRQVWTASFWTALQVRHALSGASGEYNDKLEILARVSSFYLWSALRCYLSAGQALAAAQPKAIHIIPSFHLFNCTAWTQSA